MDGFSIRRSIGCIGFIESCPSTPKPSTKFLKYADLDGWWVLVDGISLGWGAISRLDFKSASNCQLGRSWTLGLDTINIRAWVQARHINSKNLVMNPDVIFSHWILLGISALFLYRLCISLLLFTLSLGTIFTCSTVFENSWITKISACFVANHDNLTRFLA